jgi:hypothetical protein
LATLLIGRGDDWPEKSYGPSNIFKHMFPSNDGKALSVSSKHVKALITTWPGLDEMLRLKGLG